MKRYVWRRIFEIVPTTAGVLVLTFLLFHVVGGSPAETVLGKNATAEALAGFDARFGYDKPLLFGRWTPIRALGGGTGVSRALEGGGAGPLSYALPEGGYRINAGQVVLHLQNIETGETDERRVKGPPPVAFTVGGGWKAVGMDIGTPPTPALKLEKRNAGFFDSQFVNYCDSLRKGDLGASTEHMRPVAEVLREGVLPSLTLTMPILAGGTIIGVLLGLL
ncbi:MAG: hypothetical protein FWH21_02660, partial [Kiritimatiellaeota bacterium]|nr:hypothetical protein [Kiritimatiellota bacterium]